MRGGRPLLQEQQKMTHMCLLLQRVNHVIVVKKKKNQRAYSTYSQTVLHLVGIQPTKKMKINYYESARTECRDMYFMNKRLFFLLKMGLAVRQLYLII